MIKKTAPLPNNVARMQNNQPQLKNNLSMGCTKLQLQTSRMGDSQLLIMH